MSDLQVFDAYLVDRDTGEVDAFDPRIVDELRYERALAELDAPVYPRALEHDESGDEVSP